MSFLSDLATIIRSGASIQDIKELKEIYETNPTVQKIMAEPNVAEKKEELKNIEPKVEEAKTDEETVIGYFAKLAKEENNNG